MNKIKTKRLLTGKLKTLYCLYLFFSSVAVLKSVIVLMLAYMGIDIAMDIDNSLHPASDYVFIYDYTIIVLPIVTGVVILLSSVLTNYFMNRTCEKVEEKVHGTVVSKCADYSLFELMDQKVQELIRDSLESSTEAFSTFFEVIPVFIETFLFILIYVLAGIKMGWVYIATTIIALFGTALTIKAGENKEYDAYEGLSILRKKRKYYLRFYNDEKRHSEVVAHQAHDYFVSKIKDTDNEWNSGIIRKSVRQKRIAFFCSCELGIVFTGIFFYLVFLVSIERITVNYAVMMGTAAIMLFQQIKTVINNFIYAKESMYYIGRYYECINYVVDDGRFFEGYVSSIKMENVDFSFGENKILNGIHFFAEKGERIMLLGENGCGKTSMLNVLMGLYPGYSGDIIINNSICNKPIYQRCACVSQNFPTIHGSVKENLFVRDCTDEKIYDALRKVDLYDEIMKFEEGINHIFSIDSFMSHGQLQRLAIARLLLRDDADVWILDEPTSAMDAIHEDKILKTVFEAGRDKIIIIVTHRLGMAKLCDKIYHVQNGKIDYFGSHEDLYRENMQYQALFKSQAEMYGV